MDRIGDRLSVKGATVGSGTFEIPFDKSDGAHEGVSVELVVVLLTSSSVMFEPIMIGDMVGALVATMVVEAPKKISIVTLSPQNPNTESLATTTTSVEVAPSIRGRGTNTVLLVKGCSLA